MYQQQHDQMRLSIFDRLVNKFCTFLVTADVAAQELRSGMTPAAVRTAISRKKFPIKTEKIMGRHMVRLVDLADFLALASVARLACPGDNDLPKILEQQKKQRGQRGPGKRRTEQVQK